MRRKNSAKRTGRRAQRLLSLVLVCCMLLPGLVDSAKAVGAGNNTSRSIAIVLDNSGSMYLRGNMAWCRATYAIEVFASMMNEGDSLQVYPMFDMTAQGKTYSSQSPVTVYGGGDISVIRDLHTPTALGTPIETIDDAYQGLQKTKADEHWLIVLTDGSQFSAGGSELSRSATKKALSEKLSEYNQSVNVLYLGIGSDAAMPEVAGNSTYVYYGDKTAKSTDIGTKLTYMCNMIFGRDELSTNGSDISFDVSMKKLILFVQGSDISNVDLKTASGASVGKPTMSYSPRYSEQGAGNYKGAFGIDTSLSGYIAVYDVELDAGTYGISYSGDVSSISVYYEPDVDLVATLTDEYGSVVDPSGELYPGTYNITYGLVDKYGNATTSALLGKPDYKITYALNGQEKTVTGGEGGQVSVDVKEGDQLTGKISVAYLSGYSITKDAADLGWPSGGFVIVPRPAGMLELKLSGGQDTFNLSELESIPFTATLLYEGRPLTAAELANARLNTAITGGNACCTVKESGDVFAIFLQYAGTGADTECTDYEMTVSAAYTDEFGVEAVSNDVVVSFDVEDDGFGLDMDIEGKSYFEIPKLSESGYLRVVLSADGEPLTDEQLARTVLRIDGDGLTCEAEPLYGESAFNVRIKDDSKAQSGKYKLNVTAVSQDQVGREITAEGRKTVELNNYPQWLWILLAILIILVLSLIIFLILNAKVMPRKIGVVPAQTRFIVDGEVINGSVKPNYSGKGKKSGSLQIATPPYSGSPLVKGGFNLTLQAASPRRVKSSRRRVRVTVMSPSNTAALQSLTIGTHTLTKLDEGDGITWMLDSKPVPSASAPTNFEIAHKATCVFAGETIDGTSFMLSVQLKFE